MQLSVVIPAYNEADNVSVLVAEIEHALDGLEFELIFIDDGSSDDTRDRVRALQPTRPWLRLLCHPRNAGQSAALVSGVRAARAEWIATLDGDCQNDPTDLPALLAARDAARPVPQLIAGLRRRRRDSRLRRISSRVANGVRARLLQDGCPDTGCGLKLFPRAVFLELPAFDHMHRFLPALVRRNGGTVLSVPVHHRPRVAGQSKYGLFDRLWVGIADLAGVSWLQRRALPVRAREDEHGTGVADLADRRVYRASPVLDEVSGAVAAQRAGPPQHRPD